MSPSRIALHDEEATYNTPAADRQEEERYRDDSDEDATIPSAQAETTPLRGSGTVEFGGLTLGGPEPDSWRGKIAGRIPPQVKDIWAKVVLWVKGPNPPRVFSIHPFFPAVQHAPIALLDRYAPKRIHRFWLLILVCVGWLISFLLILRASSFSASIPGFGNPIILSCAARYWNDGNGCGLNGDQCRPFANATMPFRCPADCHKQLMLTPHAVGDQEVVYKPLVVGGPTNEPTGYGGSLVSDAVYRSDSFICASAVHSGFIENIEGGCGVMTLTGEQSSFTASKRHGIESTGFDSYFPHTFGFLRGTRAQCRDLRWPALAVSVFWTSLLSVFTTDPGVFFWTMFTALFFHVALVSDPPSLTNYYSLVSLALGRFLPSCFCMWVTYRYTVKRSLTNLTAQIEKTVLWLGAAWAGSLNNYTFDRIPIQRLTPHDIQAQPGAIPALIAVVLTIFFVALGQAWCFRLEGRMPRYLVVYGLMAGTLLIMLTLPGLSLRIHHYLLGLLLLPGTSFQNRPSLLYQGLLTGLFINGIARWGYAPILETPSSLLAGFQQDSLLPVVTVLATTAHNITFRLGPLPLYDSRPKVTYDGISVLVNDVERFRGYSDDRSYWDRAVTADDETPDQDFIWTWTRHHPHGRHASGSIHPPSSVVARPPPLFDDPGITERWSSTDDHNDDDDDEETFRQDLPEYFRFAYMAGSQVADFSKAGVWRADGSWKEMASGPSLRSLE